MNTTYYREMPDGERKKVSWAVWGEDKNHEGYQVILYTSDVLIYRIRKSTLQRVTARIRGQFPSMRQGERYATA